MHPDGTLVVEDWGNRRVVRLSRKGRFLSVIASASRSRGQLINSSGLAVDSHGVVYVSDAGAQRVDWFSPSGALIGSIGNTASRRLFTAGGPGGIAVDGAGNLYSPDGLSIVKYARDGRILARWQ